MEGQNVKQIKARAGIRESHTGEGETGAGTGSGVPGMAKTGPGKESHSILLGQTEWEASSTGSGRD